MDLNEKTVSQKYIYKGRIINMRVDSIILPNGKPASREVVEHPGGVCIVPLTDKNEIIFVNQFRYPYSEIILEIPAGKLEKGEDPLECGKRELLEEAGAAAEKYTFLGKLYPSPGYCGEIIYMYLAEGLSFYEQNLDEDEFVELKKIPLNKATEMILDNEICDAKTQTAVLKTMEIKRRES